MIVIIHRGYLGFQPEMVSAEINYSFTSPKIESFISKGLLYIPISGDLLDITEIRDVGLMKDLYKESSKIYYRCLHWNISLGPYDHTFIKKNNEEGFQFRSQPLCVPQMTSSILMQDTTDGQYLTPLIHADATLEQIDSFCVEFMVGSGRPFVWTTIDHIWKLIEASVDQDRIYPYQELRTGPSKYVLALRETKKVSDQISEVFEDAKKRINKIQAKKVVKKKILVKKK